jgi:single-strand DNA-binding protein
LEGIPHITIEKGIKMNKVILLGRLTRNPEVRYTSGKDNTQLCIARYTLAVDRNFKTEGQPSADFINCVAMGKNGEFAEKYLKQGTKIAIEGRIQTGSYTDKDGKKVYTTDVVVEKHEFCESKSDEPPKSNGEFMNVPKDVGDSLPFKK